MEKELMELRQQVKKASGSSQCGAVSAAMHAHHSVGNSSMSMESRKPSVVSQPLQNHKSLVSQPGRTTVMTSQPMSSKPQLQNKPPAQSGNGTSNYSDLLGIHDACT